MTRIFFEGTEAKIQGISTTDGHRWARIRLGGVGGSAGPRYRHFGKSHDLLLIPIEQSQRHF
jgi:hypothetical protein